MNRYASALGKLAAGKPKQFSQAERKRRAERLKRYAAPKRWKKKGK